MGAAATDDSRLPPNREGGSRPAAIELVGIDKRFGAVHANQNIHLAVGKGTIHGIVGENGAGKSTLMSILYGFYHADSGEIRIDGRDPAPVTSGAITVHDYTVDSTCPGV